LIGKLSNETKVKLYYKEDWHDFIIKNISEDTKSHTCTYTAEDQHICELSKNGFDIILDRGLGNNIDTCPNLAAQILAGTDWVVGPCDVNVESYTEPMYLAWIGAESM
jgi:hypothetical protein